MAMERLCLLYGVPSPPPAPPTILPRAPPLAPSPPSTWLRLLSFRPPPRRTLPRCHRLPLDFSSEWTPHTTPAPSSRPLHRRDDVADDGTENLVVYIVKSLLRDIKGGLQFLWEQPGELKYIEFPSLQNAVRMALFTIVVVMVLIVFLATVDSAFTYILAMVLRRIN